MLFDNYRRMKRLSKHLVKGSVLFSAPVLVAGACGLIGLAALIYLKRRADKNQERSFAGFKEVRHHHKHRHSGVQGTTGSKGRTEYTEDDFIVIDADEKDIREPENEKNTQDKSTGIWVASVTSKTFHRPDCRMIGRISKANRTEVEGSIESLIGEGYKPCASCIGK